MKRILTGIIVGGLLTPGVVAHAAKVSAVCNEVTDRSGDAYYVGQNATAPAGEFKDLDVRGLAVATGKKTIVVRLTLTTTDPSSDPAAKETYSYGASFTTEGYQVNFGRTFLVAHGDTSKVPPTVTQGYTNDTVSYDEPGTDTSIPVSGVHVKVTKTAVIWTLPRKALPPLQSPGATITSFLAQAANPVSHDYAPDNASQPSAAVYFDREPSCLHPK